MNRAEKIILGVIAILALAVVFTATILPGIVKSRVVKGIAETTGRNATIKRLSINPLTLTVAIDGFVVEEKGGGPFFSLQGLKISVSPASVLRRALVLSELSLASPSLRIVRHDATRFNFSDIVASDEKEKEKPREKLFPVILKNFSLKGGSVEFDDQAVVGGRTHRIDNLEISLPWLSTLPADAEKELSPRLGMRIDAAALNISGKARPFKKEIDSSVHIALDKLKLPEWGVYAPSSLPVELTSGDLTVDADLLFRLPAAAQPELSFQGLVRLENLSLQNQRQPLLNLSLLEAKAEKVEPLAGVFSINELKLEKPELFIARNGKGEWSWERLSAPAGDKSRMRSAPAGTSVAPQGGEGVKKLNIDSSAVAPVTLSQQDEETKPEKIPLQFSLARLNIRDGSFHFRDDLPRGGFRAETDKINLLAQDISNQPDQKGKYDLSFQLDKDVHFTSTGSFVTTEPRANVSFELKGLPLEKGKPYLSAYLASSPTGLLDLSGEITFSKKEGLILEKGSSRLRNFAVRYGTGEGIDLAALALNDITFYQQKNKLEIGGARLSGGRISLSREEDGTLSPLSLLASAEKSAADTKDHAAALPEQKPGKRGDEKPLRYNLKLLELDNFNISFTDKTLPAKPVFTLRKSKLSLAGLSGPEARPARLKFGATFGKEAHIQAAGDLTPVPFRYRGTVGVSRLPLRDFEAYYPESFNFIVLGGALDADFLLDVALQEGAPTGSFKGNAGLALLHLVDSFAEEDLLKWQRLQFDKIDGVLSPLRLVVGQVSLNDFYSRIIIRKDGSLNLQNLISKSASEAETTVNTSTATADRNIASPPPSPPAASRPDINIGAVTIADGVVAFTDKHLPGAFETTFYNLGGRISGLSSETFKMADVDLRGNLQNQSPLQITGKINPLRGNLFVDLKIAFSDIELSPLSAYSETYLGYILKQGKLFLDLSYHIENSKLASKNKVRIDQFAFGDKVESDKATSLPVRLGIALLRDRHGEINLDIPVAGSIDDPQFSIWRIVIQVLKNLLVKAATAPFSLLSSLFTGDEDPSLISFSPGSAALEQAEQKKLEALTKGLLDRPALKLSVIAYVDEVKDKEGYRSELLERKLRREKFLDLVRKRKAAPDASESAITLLAGEYPRYIKAVYDKEKFPKPRDAKGMEITLPEEEMEKLILANIKVEKNELETLARERRETVKSFLTDSGGIAADRIFEKNDDIFKQPEKGDTPRSRVELAPALP